jgi:F0F1-type ATP synthase assembly protein I
MVAVLLALLSLLAGPVAAYSSLFGSLAVYLPGMMFTVLVMRKIGGDSAVFLRTAMLAEFGKLALTPLAAGYFFLGMIGVLIASWFGLAKVFQGQ